MNSISNIWNHPKTSAAGLLIAIVTIAGVLSQQNITLGAAGSGTVVTLIGAVATALLGLFAKDPSGDTAATDTAAKLGAWALIALLLPFASGCSGTSVAQDIVSWTPTLQSAVATVNATGALLDPAAAPIFIAATAGFDAASNLLVARAKTYLAKPTTTVLAQLQAQVVVLQQQVSASLLSLARIANPSSQQSAIGAVNGVATIVSAILALVQSVSSKAAVAQMSAHATIKLASVQPFLDKRKSAATIAAHYGEPVQLAQIQVEQLVLTESHLGF